MNKLATIVILLVIILLSFSFVFFKSQTLGSAENYFNRHLRSKFASQPWLRGILGLHFDGDAKADYLGSRYRKILIEVDIFDTFNAHLQSLDLVVKEIENLTRKKTAYLISDKKISYERKLTREEIGKIVTRYRTHRNSSDTATLYLLYGSSFQDDGDLVGLTHQEYGIVLFMDYLEKFTKESPETLENYEASTILHEFGHQVGLPHNAEPGCLMNEQVQHGRRWERLEDVVVEFCEYEKNTPKVY